MKQSDLTLYRQLTTGYNEYIDKDGKHWFIPSEEAPCPDCNGTGKLWTGFDDDDDDGDYCDCMNCDGIGRIETEHHDLKLSIEDYHSVIRQEKWLRKRYGYVIPLHITDYWVNEHA